MKQGDDMFAVWGGIMGCQHGFLLLLDAVLAECPKKLPQFWNLVSAAPARRFGLAARKGRIAPGMDADLVLVERTEPRAITADELLYRHKTSSYVGAKISSRVARSLLRGEDVGSQSAGGRFISREVV
jgi:allantoinase